MRALRGIVSYIFCISLIAVLTNAKASTTFLRRRKYNRLQKIKWWGPLDAPYTKNHDRDWRNPTWGGVGGVAAGSGGGGGGGGGGYGDGPPTAVTGSGDGDGDGNKKHPASLVLMGWSSWTVTLAAAVAATVDWYTCQLGAHPVVTKIVTSALLGICGDSICQHLERRATSAGKTWGGWNYRRTLIFTAVAGLYLAPATHFWFAFLDGLPLPAERLERSLIMVAIDQTVGAVTITAGLFFALEFVSAVVPPYAPGASLRPSHIAATAAAAYDACRQKIFHILTANWKVWPVANFLNFLLVPLDYRVLVVSLLQLGWNVFLSKALTAAPAGLGEGLGSPGSDGGLLEVLDVDGLDKQDKGGRAE